MPPRLRKKSKIQEPVGNESDLNVRSVPLPPDPDDHRVSPPSPAARPSRDARPLLSRRSISSLRNRVAKGVARGGKIMRGGFANLGEGFSRITDSTGTRRNVSDPLRSSPTGSQEDDNNEHSNEGPDQLSPLLGPTAKRGLRERLKRPRKSDTTSDSDGSLSGGSQGQARKNAAVSTRHVSEMGVLQSRKESEAPSAEAQAEQPGGAISPSDASLRPSDGDAADRGRRIGDTGQTAYPTPPPTEPSRSPQQIPSPSIDNIHLESSPSPPALLPTLASILTPSPTPERPRKPSIVAAPLSPASPVSQGAYTMLGEDTRRALTSVLEEHMSSRARAEIERLLGWHSPPEEAEGQVLGPSEGPAVDLLGNVRESFMEMAPWAFHAYSELEDDREFYKQTKMAVIDTVGFWTKVWESFDFEESQQIDTELEPEQQPRDIQILLAAIGADDGSKREERLKDAVVPASQKIDRGDLARGTLNIWSGSWSLGRMLRFGHGIHPIPVAPATRSPSVPFPWLDTELSHWRHRGWRLSRVPDINDQYTDYNDEYALEDPLREEYDAPSDHFRRWRYGGLLMTDVRVPLPKVLFEFSSSTVLAQAVEMFYSEDHPLCMIDEAYRFARMTCGRQPTDADLRAAMVYQIVFCLHRWAIPCNIWGHLTGNWDLA